MDIRRYTKKYPDTDPGCSTSSIIRPASAAIARESPDREPDSNEASFVENEADNPPKRSRTEQIKQAKKRMSFNPRLLLDFPWVRHDSATGGAFCTMCEKWGKSPAQTRGTWVSQPFMAWKNQGENAGAC